MVVGPNGQPAHETGHDRWMAAEHVAGLVSVIVPTHDRGYILPEALGSVLAQTYRPTELIIVDDGSTDDTSSVVASWAADCTGSRGFDVRYRRQEHRGAQAARNRGLMECRGQYIQFLDSDDVLAPDKLTLFVRALEENPAAGLAYGSWHIRAAKRRTVCQPPDIQARPWPQTVAVRNLWTAAPLYRRDVVRRTGPWEEDLLHSQEWVYNVRAMTHVNAAVYVPGVHAERRRGRKDRIGRLKGRDARYIAATAVAVERVHAILIQTDGLTENARAALASRMVRAVRTLLRRGFTRCARDLLAHPLMALVEGTPWEHECQALGRLAALPPFWTRLAWRVRWLLQSLCGGTSRSP